MIESILLAVDVSDGSSVAGDYALDLAGRFDASVHCLYVLDDHLINMPHWADYGAVSLPTLTFKDDMRALLETQADLALSRFQEKAEPTGVPFETEKRTGIPAHTVLEAAKANDLLIMGRRGESNQLDASLELGSTTEKVLRKSHLPVLIAPASFSSIERVVIGFDGSERASATMHYAIEFAERLELPVLAVSVHDDEAVADKRLETVRHYAQDHHVSIETHATSGEVAAAILDQLQENDLIAIGAFGENRMREFLFGSTTETLLKIAPCPVLLHR